MSTSTVSPALPTQRHLSSVRLALIIGFAFICTVFLANWLTTRYGFVSVGFGLSATAGTYAAGMAFGFRDLLHETAGRLAVVAAILTGAAVSALVAPELALASALAFLLSETADLGVYEPLRRRRWVLAVVASNLVGATVDTVMFLWVAGFPIRSALAGQMVGKALMIAPALALMAWWRRAR